MNTYILEDAPGTRWRRKLLYIRLGSFILVGKIEDVEITEEIDIWLNMLVKEYEMILNGKEQETENAFVDHIFNTMEYLNSFLWKNFICSRNFYNELLNNSHEVRYQAILDLLDKIWRKK